ncbi:MAG: hypothetical protein WC348_02700 [Patescibacteria group bacterium]|jgi:hypothetical protein
MLGQNQNDLFQNIDGPVENQTDSRQEMMESAEPMAMPAEAVPFEVTPKIYDAPAKTELKDLEISFNFEKIELIKKIVKETQDNLRRINCLLGEDAPKFEEKIKQSFLDSDIIATAPSIAPMFSGLKTVSQPDVAYGESGERIMEGVFNGQNMIGADGKEYLVPSNYASKSKLVEGDILKLTINARGNFLFKQIGPMERNRVVGMLEEAESGGWTVASGGKKWRVLAAPVTYFKGEMGDEAVILIPKNTPSKWAAVENVIKRNEV